jgi:hypothetical protein
MLPDRPSTRTARLFASCLTSCLTWCLTWCMAWCLASMAGLPCVAADPSAAPPTGPGLDFFERKIRPVLVKACYDCHSVGAETSEGNLLLDTRAGIRKGGSRGPSVVPGQPEKSTLLAAIRQDDHEFAMPPDGAEKLPAAVIADFTAWIAMGAPDPRDGESKPFPKFDVARARKEHWAFQTLQAVAPPTTAHPEWNGSPIDAFIRSSLDDRGLAPAAEAEPLTWLRRVHLDLVGLPPTPAEQRQFAADPSSEARERVVDDLLHRPQYGERWGRHWLDVARYAETNGYEHDGLRPHSWRYRDWVIAAVNEDLPYDRFVLQQLAGDEIEGSDAASQIATSFLCLGPFDHASNDGRKAEFDLYDDMVGTTASAFLGLTLQCARCHDHKFEPISQADYYRLMAAFEPYKIERGESMAGPVREVGTPAELEARRAANERLDDEAGPILGEYDLLRIAVLERLPAKLDGPPKERPKKGLQDKKAVANVLGALQLAPIEREKKFRGLLQREEVRLEDSLRELATADELARLAGFKERIAAIDARRPDRILASIFSEQPKPPVSRIHLRGEHTMPGDEVTFAPPEVLLTGPAPEPQPTASTSGRRLALARWITGPAASLAARVMANRVWQYHFGVGLMQDANDFGIAGGTPTHPALLEWLAHDLVDGGWRLKRLHRQIVLSRTYRLSATPADPRKAPEAESYAAWPVHRLDAEPIRDSILAASGALNLKGGGPSIHPPFDQKIVGNSARNDWKLSDPEEAARRSVYVFAKRAIPYPDLSILGLPESSVSCGKRAVATTSVQALLMINGKFVAEQATRMAARVRREAGGDVARQVELAFALTLCRPPRTDEMEMARGFATSPTAAGSDPHADPLTALCVLLFNTNEFIYAN